MKRPQYYKNAYRQFLKERIEELDSPVFARNDLTQDYSNREQLRLNRALKMFVADGYLIKISHGLYAKATKMELSPADTRIVLRDTFESVAIAALDKLGIKWELGSAIQAYNRNETTQVPAVFTVKLRSRFRGTITAEGRTLLFEDGINAR